MPRTPQTPCILVVDDDAGITSLLCEVLQDAGYRTVAALSGREAYDALQTTSFDLVVSDLVLPDLRGSDLLAHVLEHAPGTPVILITAFGSIDMAVAMLRKGAFDFIAKPFAPDQLLLAIERAFAQRRATRAAHEPQDDADTAERVFGRPRSLSPAVRRVESLAMRAAVTDTNLLITGESGTGKTQLAKQLHEHSPRQRGPFVVLNCGAIPAALVESELFGVTKGAFTDAKKSRAGLVQSAHTGTLFLDEIADLPPEAQAKLLRVLERRVVRPLGAVEETPVDIRVISATHQSLEEAVAAGRFRADLYYRLHVIRIDLPPLRARAEDIVTLAEGMLADIHRDTGQSFTLREDARAWLIGWSWPGNIRELSNRLQRATALARGTALTQEDVSAGDTTDPLVQAGAQRPPHVRLGGGGGAQAQNVAEDGLLADGLPASWEPRTLLDVEREHIQRTLIFTGGNKALAAELLGIDRRTLYRRLAEDA